MVEVAQDKDYRYVGDLADYALVEELKDRGALFAAYSTYKREHPWWHRFLLSTPYRAGWGIWGLSTRWFAICPWNGEEAWITLPFLYFSIGTMHIELRLGGHKYGVTFDTRWRWE